MHIEVRGKLLYHWVLVAGNGEVLATSETYYSKSNAERAAWRLSKAIGVEWDRQA
jgi:uncharacterized protein YegP (UPF0339 family)